MIKSWNKSGAVELSVNMIVITVLSLIVLGIGFYLVTSLFSTATEYKGTLDEQTEQNILTALKKPGELISLPITQYSIERGETDVIGVGLLNNIDTTLSQTFYISVTCTEALAEDETELCNANGGSPCNTEATGYCTTWPTLGDEQRTINNRDAKVVSIFFAVPDDAPSGTFGYNLKICTGKTCGSSGSTQYGPTKKFYVTVPE